MRRNAYRLLNGIGVASVFRWLHRRQVAVLMYHGILPDDDPLAEDSWLQVRTGEFRRQMKYVKTHYEVVRLADLLKPDAKWGGRPRIAVTFDDGYANNYHWALPVLQEFGIPATIFVATAYLDTRRLFWWDCLRLTLRPIVPPLDWIRKLKSMEPSIVNAEINRTFRASGLTAITRSPQSLRALTSEELRALIDSGLIEIGSHTHDHDILERISDERVRATLRTSVEVLTGLGVTARLFAAPNGDYTPAQIALIAEQGFEACVSTEHALWDLPAQPYRIPRFGVGRGISQDEFALMISGCLSWVRRLREMLAGIPACLKSATAAVRVS